MDTFMNLPDDLRNITWKYYYEMNHANKIKNIHNELNKLEIFRYHDEFDNITYICWLNWDALESDRFIHQLAMIDDNGKIINNKQKIWKYLRDSILYVICGENRCRIARHYISQRPFNPNWWKSRAAYISNFRGTGYIDIRPKN